MKFKEGDIVKVLPRKIDQETQYPSYVNEMLCFVDREFHVVGYYKGGSASTVDITDKHNRYDYDDLEMAVTVEEFTWHEDWLALVEPEPILILDDKDFLV